MSDILKGNYEVPDSPQVDTTEDPSKTLTDKFEEATLAKIGGSICFVMKNDSFLWTGDSETPE